MPTPAERKALLFLAGVIVLGASVRVVRAARDDGASDAAQRQALARQLAAVDSARGSETHARRSTKASSRVGQQRGAPRRARQGSAVDSSAKVDSAEWWVREPLSEVGGGSNAGRGEARALVDLGVAGGSGNRTPP